MDDLAQRVPPAAIESLTINTIRCLAMDAVQRANSGHPGTPMALAPAAYVLWKRFLRHNPRNPDWFNRDRFVLSNGHASMLLYALLHLTGYELSLEELMSFRQWGSKTPGHPEYGVTPGVETTTGPLGQGFMNGVGMAIAEAHLAALFNREGHTVIDHFTYLFCSDGDLMEGASHEAASVAGHLGLGKLICLYDDNHITIDGPTEISYSDDAAKRFEACHWHVQNLGDIANDLEVISAAIEQARQVRDRPSLIIIRSHIAYGAPHAHDTSEAHGAPLGEDEVKETKGVYGWPEVAKFWIPDRVKAHMREAIDVGAAFEQEWNSRLAAYREGFPEEAKRLQAAMSGELPSGWSENLPYFEPGSTLSTRAASGVALNHFAEKIPWLVGGAGDLATSTKASIKAGGDFEKESYSSRNFHWGVREHLMCGASSGMALHGGVRPFASTFLIFTDYARPAIRLAALMKLPVIYVMSHDSIGLGEDGPTHQPVEHLASFRAMPNMCVIRPADANETVYAWQAALSREGPTMLVLTRQELPVLDRDHGNSANGVLKGAYIFSKETEARPDLILIASGSEVALAVAAQRQLLAESSIDSRVVSMPSWELFRQQSQDYRNAVFPPDVKPRLAIEAASPLGWREWIGDDGGTVTIDRFGASAPGHENFSHYGFSVENIVLQARSVVESTYTTI